MTHQEPTRFRMTIFCFMGTIGVVPMIFGSVAELPVTIGGRVPVKDVRLVTRVLNRRVMRNRITPDNYFLAALAVQDGLVHSVFVLSAQEQGVTNPMRQALFCVQPQIRQTPFFSFRAIGKLLQSQIFGPFAHVPGVAVCELQVRTPRLRAVKRIGA